MPAESATKTRIDRSKTYLCHFSCGFATTWPAALGRHESARHNGHSAKPATLRPTSGEGNATSLGKARPPHAPAKIDRLLDELRKQQEEVLQALKKTSLFVLAERDLRAREAEQIKTDLLAIDEVLERNRGDRERRLNALIR
jgi:hypothetical protein